MLEVFKTFYCSNVFSKSDVHQSSAIIKSHLSLQMFAKVCNVLRYIIKICLTFVQIIQIYADHLDKT